MLRALAVLIAICGGVALADAPRAVPIGFDHMVHDRTVVVNGTGALACTRCHTGKGNLAKPDHATCFAKGCHAAPATTPKAGGKLAFVDDDQKKLCTNCHAEALLDAPLTGKPGAFAVAYPPYAIDPDFAARIGHKAHVAVACATCHAAIPRKAGAAPHVRCIACHDGSPAKGPAMTACETCHQRASGAPQPTKLATATLPTAFSHGKHAARGGAGKACATCHAGVADTDDSELPRPTAKTCAASGCHDARVGAKGTAFGIETAACSKCHTTVPVRTFHIERPAERFSHGKHASLKRACDGCHRLAPTGEVLAAVHESCTGTGCHEGEFGSAKPTICGACHNTTEPWRALGVDRAPADASEFGATLDHGKHAAAACTSCHVLRTATRELRTPRGHASCLGKGCHAVSGGPEPKLGACEACHVLGLEAARDQARASAPWSVRTTFPHTKPHRGNDSAVVACTTCHTDTSATSVLALAAPAKPTCAPCHDGKTAFKLTGTACARCHGGRKLIGS